MKRLSSFVLIAVLWCQSLIAQDIVITGPVEPIQVGDDYSVLTVEGLTTAELPQADVRVEPAGSSYRTCLSLQFKPEIWFRAKKDGKFTVTVSVGPVNQNSWVRGLVKELGVARTNELEADLLEPLERDVFNITQRYPTGKSASIEIQVGKPNPPDPPPVKQGKRNVVIVREQNLNTWNFSSLLTLIQNDPAFNAFCKLRGHTKTVLDPDVKDENGQPSAKAKPWLDIVRNANIKMPAIIITDGATNVVVFKGEVPQPYDIATLQKLIMDNGG